MAAPDVDPWLAALRELGTPERATFEKGYLKSSLEHVGVKVPDVRKVARRLCREHPRLDVAELVALTEALWARGIYELRSLAVFVLERRRSSFDDSSMAFFEATLRKCGTWALVDTLAISVVGDVVCRFDAAKPALAHWAVHEDFWLRRASVLALLGAWRRGASFDEARFTAFAVPMLEETEFFVRKGLGWVLRDLSKKEPGFPAAFLLAHRDRVSGLTLREGAKHLPDDVREALGLSQAPVSTSSPAQAPKRVSIDAHGPPRSPTKPSTAATATPPSGSKGAFTAA
ncbi:MAG: DNA alkylation repair protein [Myxococcota bacterium]